jgi:hypothetical protein
MSRVILSSGGGADSFAMLLHGLARGERPDEIVFADTGDEWPETYRHLREVVMPLAAREGIPFAWLDGKAYPIRGHETLLAYFEAMRLMPGRQSRLCTSAAKVERIAAYLARTYPGETFEVWVGFEAGEEKRAENDPHGRERSSDGRRNRFPLIEANLCRCRAEALIRAAGYEVPPKSACDYCPFGTRGDFQTLQRERPERFARIERLEDNCRPTKSGKVMRFGYRRGDGTDPRLGEWASRPYQPRPIPCKVCGAPMRAAKRVGCGA